MAIKAYYLTPEGELKRDLSEEEMGTAFNSKQGLLWVDIAETTEEDGDFLEWTFNFHHLAVEDCVSRQNCTRLILPTGRLHCTALIGIPASNL